MMRPGESVIQSQHQLCDFPPTQHHRILYSLKLFSEKSSSYSVNNTVKPWTYDQSAEAKTSQVHTIVERTSHARTSIEP